MSEEHKKKVCGDCKGYKDSHNGFGCIFPRSSCERNDLGMKMWDLVQVFKCINCLYFVDACCKRRAPVNVNCSGTTKPFPVWPATEYNDWCGDYEYIFREGVDLHLYELHKKKEDDE